VSFGIGVGVEDEDDAEVESAGRLALVVVGS
jgi:hypothetical protein